MPLNKRERTLLTVTVTAIVLGVNYVLVVPLAGKWKSFGGILATRRRELDSRTETIKRSPEWRKQYDELRHNISEKSARFDQTSDVLKKIDEVGGASGILIQSRRPMQPVDRDVYRELPVQCSFESSTESLVKFLYGLQTGAGLVSVEELRITPRADNPSILRCDIQIRALASKAEAPTS
jgi:Tfp pilus assembly protein PilO